MVMSGLGAGFALQLTDGRHVLQLNAIWHAAAFPVIHALLVPLFGIDAEQLGKGLIAPRGNNQSPSFVRVHGDH